MASGRPGRNECSHMTSTRELLQRVDRTFAQRFGVHCESRLHQEAQEDARGRRYRVVQRQDGTYKFFLDGSEISRTDPRLTRREDAGTFHDLLARVQQYNTLEVRLGPDTFHLSLFPASRYSEASFAELPSFIIALQAPMSGEQSVLGPDRERRLREYISVLREHDRELEETLGVANEWAPEFIQDIEICDQLTFVSDTGEKRHEILVNLGFGCNQNCLFCCVRAHRRPFFTFERITGATQRYGERLGEDLGGATLTLTGGEPTMHRRIVHVIEAAREMGFRKIRLQTNGVLLSRIELVEDLHRAGVDAVTLSFHSHRPEVYDRITRTRRLFPLVLKAIENLKRVPLPSIHFNIVVTRQNVADFPDYVDFVGRLPRHARTRFSIMPSVIFMATDNGNWSEVAISLSDFVPHLREAVRRATRTKHSLITAMVGDCAMPPCITNPYPELRVLAPNGRFISDTEYVDDPAQRQTDVARVKHRACRDCRYDTHCGGVSSLYARTFGLDELTPTRT